MEKKEEGAPFLFSLRLTVFLSVLFALTFVYAIMAEMRVRRAAEQRLLSRQLSTELLQSSNDLTRMVRSYVATGDPVFKRNYNDILSIRDGRKARPEAYWRPYWDLKLGDGPAPRRDERPVALLDMMREAGFLQDEFALLKRAKSNSDTLTSTEFSAMKLVDSAGPGASARRAEALSMLFDEKYHRAKAGIMRPIDEFFAMVDARTSHELKKDGYEAMAAWWAVVAIGLWLFFTLWRTYRIIYVNEKRARVKNAEFSALLVSPELVRGDLAAAKKILTESATRLAGVSRASIWKLSEDGSEMRCLDLYESHGLRHSEGVTLKCSDFPRYFEAIRFRSRISAPDARLHPDTSEFAQSYLIPFNIVSMLDCIIPGGKGMLGVFCLEHCGERRDWTADDESVLATLSALTASVLEAQENRLHEVYDEAHREILQILNAPGPLPSALKKVVMALRKRVGFDAVGVRIREGEDFPYMAYDGFTEDFIRSENGLIERDPDHGVCRDENGRPHLECTCGMVLSGKADPAYPFFTRGGSFWTNDSFVFLDLPPGRDPRRNPRNKCMHNGYASLALVPIRSKDGIIGLIHLADRRKGRFTAGVIERLESAALHLGEAYARKRAEDELRESELFLRESELRAGLGSFVMDIEAGSWTSSASLDSIFGIDRRYERNMDGWTSILHPGDRSVLAAYFSGGAPGNARAFDREFRIVRRDNHAERWVHARATIERDDAGRTVKIYGTIQDINDRRRSDEEKERLRDQFLQSQKMESVGRLAGGVAHDFNNLLTAISGFASYLKTGLPADSPLLEDVRGIMAASDRGAGLTRQLLAFSRKQVLSPRLLDLNACVTEVSIMLKRLIGENIKLGTRLAARPCMINVDPGQMDQVLVNLAVNSRDAMPNGGSLTLETDIVVPGEDPLVQDPVLLRSSLVRLTVRDTGCGMSEKVKQHIFEPFFTTKEKGKGTGLGLSTVFGIVKQSGGEIAVESAESTGTVFRFYFPYVKAAPEEDAGKAASEKEVGPGGSETVLFVEDEEGLLDLGDRLLRANGYKVLTASSGKSALKALEAHGKPVDLLVTDVVMPGMSGWELAREASRLKMSRRTLFISGYSDETILRHGGLRPGMELIYKPFTTEQLLGKIREMLDGAADKPGA